VCGAVAALHRPAPSALALALGLALVALARLPRAWVLSRLAPFGIAALPFLLVLPFTQGGDGWHLGPVFVSEGGLLAGASVACRGLAVGCFALVLLGTAPVHHTLAAAHKLRVPGVLVLLALLAYRYTFLLSEELRRVWIALRTRGFRVHATRHGYRTLAHASGALLVRGTDRAEAVAAAMRTRGFDGTFHTLCTFRTTAADILGCLALAACAAALVTWDRL
jgi:cobalt/nickel transport system permease protein